MDPASISFVRAEDLPSDKQECPICETPFGFPKNVDHSREYPVLLVCGCICGYSCLEQFFGPRCLLCQCTIRVIPGVNAPLHHGTSSYLRDLEQRTGIDEWPLPSIEGGPVDLQKIREEARMEEAEPANYDLQAKLDVLNGCYGTFLSKRELTIIMSLIDYRLGTTTSVGDFLDAFIKYPLFDHSRWERSADMREYLQEGRPTPENPTTDGVLKDVLMLVNMRAGTSFLLDELELAVSLMNFIHGEAVGLLDVLGLRDAGLGGGLDLPQSALVERELVGPFGNMDIGNAVGSLGDVFSQASL